MSCSILYVVRAEGVLRLEFLSFVSMCIFKSFHVHFCVTETEYKKLFIDHYYTIIQVLQRENALHCVMSLIVQATMSDHLQQSNLTSVHKFNYHIPWNQVNKHIVMLLIIIVFNCESTLINLEWSQLANIYNCCPAYMYV